MSRSRRSAFLDREAVALGRFINRIDPRTLVGWTRTYRCGCGFTCRAAAEIWDHTKTCEAGDEGLRQGS